MSHLSAAIRAAAEAVIAHADELNRLDAQAGDGDLGVTMTVGARSVIEVLPSLEERPPAELLRACGAALARDAPSTCGTLVATALLRGAAAVTEQVPTGATGIAQLLDAAQTGIADRGKAERGSKTMLDAIAPAAEAATEAASRGESGEQALESAAAAADAGAKATVGMVPRHGRAGWLAERSAGHEDAGARLVAVVLAAAARSLGEAGRVTEDAGLPGAR
jgi:phosphoenolpyruvate---glycerone phosphotransferase subunit DhaL